MKISPLRPLLYAFLCVGAFLPPVGADSSDGDTHSSWTIQRETDPIFDVPNVTAHLRETGAKSSLPGIEKALVMRCVEQKLDVFVVWGVFGALGSSSSTASSLEVVWRFDSTSPRTQPCLSRRVQEANLQSHRFQRGKQQVLVLGCHDLNMFSGRAWANMTTGSRRQTRSKDMRDLTGDFKPTMILQGYEGSNG